MSAEELTELAATVTNGAPLAGLGALARLRGEAERTEAVLVRRARNSGATWLQIADALGVSKQAVHKKHGGRRRLGGSS